MTLYCTCLDACHWIKQAVQSVKPSTVVTCFALAGIQSHTSSEVDNTEDEEDTFAQVVDIAVHQLKLPQPTNFDDYTNVDTGISSSEELTDGWEQTLAGEFLTEKEKGQNRNEVDNARDDDEDSTDDEPIPAIKTFTNALKSISDLKVFAATKGRGSAFTDLIAVQGKFQQALMESRQHACQTSITGYFQS